MTQSQTPPHHSLPAWLRMLRPAQWTKNGLVAAACFFAIWDPDQNITPLAAILHTLWAMAIFCIVSSGIYILNDLRDIDSDRHHPVKCLRPIAAGEIRPPVALVTALILLVSGIACTLPGGFTATITIYIALQLAYTTFLKQVALLDIFIIAAGFVLRAIAGGMAISVEISPWLLLCTFLLALFLALCKRRHEKTSLGEQGKKHRSALLHYDQHLLDQFIAIISAATIVSYSMYTLAGETCEKFGTHALGFTIPFVIFGIFRYLDLVYRHDVGGHPERILLTDPPILINVLLFAITAAAIFIIT